MEGISKVIGEHGGFFVDSSAAVTGEFIYAIQVLTDCVFTVLKEGAESGGAGTDVMAVQNLTSKTVTAGCLLVPTDKVFTDVTITSGSLYCYRA